MAERGQRGRGLQGAQSDAAGRVHGRGPRGVDEQHRTPAQQVQRVFDLPLEVGQQFHIPTRVSACRQQRIPQRRAERIVTTARVAHGQHQQRGQQRGQRQRAHGAARSSRP